jgi:hypothetical protein
MPCAVENYEGKCWHWLRWPSGAASACVAQGKEHVAVRVSSWSAHSVGHKLVRDGSDSLANAERSVRRELK